MSRRAVLVLALLSGALAGCSSTGAETTGLPTASPTMTLGLEGAGATGARATEALTDPQLSLGREVYIRECAVCHGARGEGEPDWMITRDDGSLPAPPHDATGHTWHHSDAELLAIIADGGTVYMPNSNMPGYRDRLGDTEIAAVLAYIKTMWGPTERTYQAERTRDWELMTGGGTPTAAP